MARELLEESEFLMKLAAVRPDHLVDPNGLIRASELVDKASVMEAIYSTQPGFSFVQTTMENVPKLDEDLLRLAELNLGSQVDGITLDPDWQDMARENQPMNFLNR